MDPETWEMSDYTQNKFQMSVKKVLEKEWIKDFPKREDLYKRQGIL